MEMFSEYEGHPLTLKAFRAVPHGDVTCLGKMVINRDLTEENGDVTGIEPMTMVIYSYLTTENDDLRDLIHENDDLQGFD